MARVTTRWPRVEGHGDGLAGVGSEGPENNFLAQLAAYEVF